ncbi:hypothetical protein ACROYT_G014883 [Oculina patagonica]
MAKRMIPDHIDDIASSPTKQDHISITPTRNLTKMPHFLMTAQQLRRIQLHVLCYLLFQLLLQHSPCRAKDIRQRVQMRGLMQKVLNALPVNPSAVLNLGESIALPITKLTGKGSSVLVFKNILTYQETNLCLNLEVKQIQASSLFLESDKDAPFFNDSPAVEEDPAARSLLPLVPNFYSNIAHAVQKTSDKEFK